MRVFWPCLCLLALLACAPRACAQSQPIYRCIGAHGEPVFSGQPCGAPAPAPGVNARLGSFGGVCVASPEALRQSIATAFARHDVNHLAGLILWRGMDRSSARAALHSLADWLQQPLTGIASAAAAGPPPAGLVPWVGAAEPAVAASVAPVPSGFQISTGGVEGHSRDFGVTQVSGCWWLTF